MPVSVEEVASSPPPQSGKRRRSEEEDSPGRNRKSSRNSNSAQSLVPHYQKTPKDATQIQVPVYDPGADWDPSPPSRVQQRKMGAPYRPSNGVRPTNTLGHWSVQSGNKRQQPSAQQRQGVPSVKSSTHASRSEQQQLPLSTSRGSNVTPLELDDDLEAERPPHKKSRMESSLVDSNSFDYTDGEAIPARQGNRRSTSHGSATEVSERSRKRAKGGGDAFGNNELYTTDMEGGNWRAKSSRLFSSVKAGVAAPQRVAQTGQLHAGRDHSSNGTAQNPVDVDADDGQPKTVPTMNLIKGVKEAGDAHKQKRLKAEQGSSDDMAKVDDVFATNAGHSRQPNAKAHPVPTTRRTIPQSQVIPFGQISARRISKSNATQEHRPGDIRRQFFRDVEQVDGEDQPVETIRMLSRAQIPEPRSSSRPQTRDHSPDVLDGETTVGSQKSRSASPKKSAQLRFPGKAGIAQGHATARPSESSLKPTNFTRASDQRPATSPNTNDDIWELSEDGNNDGHLGIAAIYCRGFACSEPGYKLVWDANHEYFVLADASGSFVYSPWRKLPVQICRSAVTHGFMSNKASLKVILRGSSDWMSTGTILLHFLDSAGKDFFYGAFCDSLGTKLLDTDHEKLGVTFAHRANNEYEGFLMLQRRAQKHAPQTQRAPDYARSQADEESIIYEDDQQPPQREKLVSKMKAETISEVLQAQEQQHNGIGQSRSHQGETVSHHFANGSTRRSTRQARAAPQYREPSPELTKWTEKHELPKWPRSVVYPQVGTRRVTVDVDNLRNLDAGEFLNDNIVNYALRHIEETMAPAHKDRVHFFNTFFFSSLTTKNGKKDFNYDAVKKWTKNADLLSKPYIVVPINLDLHWFVAIIYNLPALRRKMIDSDDDPAAEDAVDLCSESEVISAKAEEPHATAEQMAQSDGADVSMDKRHMTQDQSLDATASAGGTASSQSTITGKKGKKKRAAPTRTFPMDQPMIISLDSFGLTRTNELRIIKRYVIEEAKEKRQIAVAFEDLQGVNAKGIPQQDNFWDCGVYLIGYMKEFARDPDRFVTKILGRQIDENDFKEFDATALRDEIRENLLKFGNEQNEQHRKDKLARASARKNGQTLQVGKTAGGASTPARAKATSAEASAPPTSSQPAPGSPAAAKVIRHATSIQTQAELAPEDAPPSSATVMPSPVKDVPYEGGVEDNEDELEVEAPKPLTNKVLASDVRSIPNVKPAAKQDHGADEEMLDVSDAREDRFDAPRSATPLRHSVTVAHNAGLSPLSSLERDNGILQAKSPGFASAAAASFRNDVANKAQPAATVKTREQDTDTNGEANPLLQQVVEEESSQGFTEDTGNNEPEIPDSQPEARQSQDGQSGKRIWPSEGC